MKIAFILQSMSPQGGTGRYATSLSSYLVERGHSVTAFVARTEGAPSNIEVRKLPASGHTGLRGLGRFALAAAGVRRSHFDVVQGFGRTVHHDVYRAGGGCHQVWLERQRRHPLRRMAMAFSARDRLELWIDRAAMQRARVVVFNSEMARNQAIDRYDLSAGRCRVVRNGVDTARFAPNPLQRRQVRASMGVPPGGRVVLFVGNGFRRKGLRTAAAAAARVLDPRDRFVVVGRDGRAARYRRDLRGVLGSRLEWIGNDPRPERWLQAADAVLLPTLYDSAANTTLEAWAAGVPALTSGWDGNASLAPDPGLVVRDPLDVREWTAALRWVLEASEDLGARCRQAMLAWPVSRNGVAMESIYEELIHGQG